MLPKGRSAHCEARFAQCGVHLGCGADARQAVAKLNVAFGRRVIFAIRVECRPQALHASSNLCTCDDVTRLKGWQRVHASSTGWLIRCILAQEGAKLAPLPQHEHTASIDHQGLVMGRVRTHS